jgi:CheY-like chemotaxis protein
MELAVRDTGPGIAVADQEKIFELFSRLELTAQKEGSGLGLAVSAAICKACGGNLRVESSGGNGACFVALWALVPVEAPKVVVSTVVLRGLRVLIADDNVLVRDLFVAYLSESGALCATASDGLDALNRIGSETFDALVVDLAMPGADGLTVARRVRGDGARRGLRIVGVSAHAGADEHEQALAAGMDVFISKPVALPELARALAPAFDEVIDTTAIARLRSQAERRFRTEAAGQAALLEAAWQQRDWPAMQAAAHHLKNSAFVVEDAELAEACGTMMAAAREVSPLAAKQSWGQCERALQKWTVLPESFSAGVSGGSSNQTNQNHHA